jgi:adenine-specific DNA methylase
MEGFKSQTGSNSTKPIKTIMVDVNHNIETYHEWYKKKWKENTHEKAQSLAKIVKEHRSSLWLLKLYIKAVKVVL